MSENVWQEHGLTASEYQQIQELMGREPNYLELSLFGVMWSEHCSYKNSRAQLKKFPTKGKQVLQGPGENAGVVEVNGEIAVAFKVESHNHPSAIEPYQGAATGVGGIIRDIFAMGARPIASLNSLRFGEPSNERVKHLLRGVVAGIAGYGNCMGIPTVGGETFFHPSYQGNPLVNAMSVGIVEGGKIFKGTASGIGNVVMVVGARTGRDGIRGASFASEELSDEDPDKRPAVQVGDPFMEKLLLEATLEVLASIDIVGLQDLGAAGLTSSAAEMAGRSGSGLYIDVTKVPLREEGMAPWEIMLSESQERMLFVVKPEQVAAITAIFDKWDLSAAAIGKVTGDGYFTIRNGEEVLASVDASLLTDNAPVNIRPYSEPAYYRAKKVADVSALRDYGDWNKLLTTLLASPNIASKAWIYEQYDHMVGINTVVRPGSDAAVLALPDSQAGIALSIDCNSRYVYLDPWRGGAIAVAEAARNVACSGAKPLAITNCLNFGNPEKEEIYWQFVKATDGIAQACLELGTPVTGGNVSFYNEYDGVGIFPTPTIGMVGELTNVEHRLTSAFVQAGDEVLLVGASHEELGASEALYLICGEDTGEVPYLDFEQERALHEFLWQAAQKQLLKSAHDCSEGGLSVALAESAIQGGVGVTLDWQDSLSEAATLFGESQSRAVISFAPQQREQVLALIASAGLPYQRLGVVNADKHFAITYNGKSVISTTLADLDKAWREAIPCAMK